MLRGRACTCEQATFIYMSVGILGAVAYDSGACFLYTMPVTCTAGGTILLRASSGLGIARA
eukprot:1897143-Rhodomonas_salina.1